MKMMRPEAKATRNANRPPSWKSSSYVSYGLLLGSLLVLLYLMVSTQFSYSQKALLELNPATFSSAGAIPSRHERVRRGQGTHAEDVSRRMEDLNREEEEVAKARAEQRRQEKQGESEQQWAHKNSIEEQSGHEMKSDNWEEKNQAEKEETVESRQFGGGTDDYNNVADAKPICDTSFGKYDICELAGDTRAQGGPNATVTLVSPRAPPQEWEIRPYSRKYLDGLKAVAVRSVPSAEDAPQCTTRLNIPAMVIELGGLTGNYWHDFTDVLVPLFIGARRFNGEVQLLVLNLMPFWVDRYKRVFARISRHEIVDFESDDGGAVVRCYPHVVVGYGSRKEFTIDPSLDETGGGYTMVDFTEFLRRAYSLPSDRPIKLAETRPPGGRRRRRPRMIILERTNSRKILNLPEVIAAAESVGFEVTVAGRPKPSYDDFTREMNSFDVMVGVHGAGLTNCVFLPRGAVLLQIVPYGRLEEIARTDFGDPARDMGLRYVEYGVAAEESSLMSVFGKEHPIVKDPAAVHKSGWGNVAEWYLAKQDVRINVHRFRPSLIKAMEHLQ